MNERDVRSSDLWRVKRALISVSDKAGLIPLAASLTRWQIEMVASAGTANYLRQQGFSVTSVEEITEKPEAFGGRVKTLGFPIASGILYHREKESDLRDAETYQVQAYDLVVVNFYPFAEKKSLPLSDQELIEFIDIGGPTLLRAAAKNYHYVCALAEPKYYEDCMELLNTHQGFLPLSFRRKMMAATFFLTSQYDQSIYQAFDAYEVLPTPTTTTPTPEMMLQKMVKNLSEGKIKNLRYGENPHQQAFLVVAAEGDDFTHSSCLQGKELSYNNWPDAYVAWALASDLYFLHKKEVLLFQQENIPKHAVVVVKHQNPCGAALGTHDLSTLVAAWNGDKKSSFGGVVAFSTLPSKEAMSWLLEHFVEVIILPVAEPELPTLCQRKKNLRVLIAAPQEFSLQAKNWELHSLQQGFLLQSRDPGFESSQQWSAVTRKKFPEEKYSLVAFGLEVLKYLKSNAIGIFAFDDLQEHGQLYSLLAAGLGLTNRIEALSLLALPKAKEQRDDLRETVCLSEAFFPFADIIDELVKIPLAPRYLVQPGGALRDEEVINRCNQESLFMLFTHRRHFRH